MVWPLDLQRLYYVGPGDNQALDSMFIAGARGRKSPTEKLKKLRNEFQMRPDAEGIGSLFAENGGKWNHRALQFLLREHRKVHTPAEY